MQNLQNINLEAELSDEALLYAIADGSGWAMESLYTRYYRLLYTLAYRMVANPQVAEDLLQDAFLSVWRRSNTYSPHAGAARNWLFSILQHRAIDHLRKLQRRGTIQEAPLDLLDLDEKTASVAVWETAWHLAQGSHVHITLINLPPDQLIRIQLAYF